ncbi:hypothetical protein WG66_007323 [Moniliophthora roreri]|nr:hypothetical protein WG66_007323 [Moniliophthora roreri]
MKTRYQRYQFKSAGITRVQVLLVVLFKNSELADTSTGSLGILSSIFHYPSQTSSTSSNIDRMFSALVGSDEERDVLEHAFGEGHGL